jgi:hypothetical protein
VAPSAALGPDVLWAAGFCRLRVDGGLGISHEDALSQLKRHLDEAEHLLLQLKHPFSLVALKLCG